MSQADEAARLINRLGVSAPSPQVIRAYHGSPYDFDRFDASKIGTGEGNQSYGHGLYFAGNEAVSKVYRDQLKDMLDVDPTERQSLDLQDAWNDWMAKQQLVREWDNPSSGLSNLLAEFGEPNPHIASERESAARWMRLNAEIERATKNPGRMYEVEIGYPEEALLNWDRPTAPSGGVGARAADVLRAVRPRDISASDLEYIKSIRPGDYAPPAYGSSIHSVEQSLRAMAKDPAGAAELRAAGIPGVRYLDGVSRQQGGGSRNYVVFPGAEDSIRILRKFAVPGVVGTGAAAMSGEE